MPSYREGFAQKSLEELFDCLKLGPHVGAANYYKALAELECRKYEEQEAVNKAQIEAANAAKEAAEAAQKTAEYTRQSAGAMRWSVFAIFAAAVLGALIQILTSMKWF
jgi:hypothetical protein